MGACITGEYDAGVKRGMKIQIGGCKICLLERVATGAYGDIWKCKDQNNPKLYALKEMKIQSKELSQMFDREVQNLQKCDQKNIKGVIKLFGSERMVNKKGQIRETGLILTQFYEINLLDHLKEKHFCSEEILSIFKNILSTLKEIHSFGLIHLDLKLENILLKKDKNQECFLCDFGSCIPNPPKPYKEMNGRERSQQREFFQSNSTFMYRAPEMIDSNLGPITTKIDIWMLGCVIYLLLFRKHPFQGAGQLAIVTAQVDYPQFPQDSKEKNFEFLVSCLKKMLVIKVEDRFDENQLLELKGMNNN